MPELTVIVPTYREAENLPELIERVFTATSCADIKAEMLVVDDNSGDGTEHICADMGKKYSVRLITRKEERGLATAVLCGIRESTTGFLIIMDADLSHPPEEIPNLVHHLRQGADFVIGSGCAQGGSRDPTWSLFQRLNSEVARLLARGLTTVNDPLSGYFAFPRRILTGVPQLSPVGYKIGLEILAKANCRKVVEIPMAFFDRQRGESKLTLRERLLYLRHLRRLYRFRFSRSAEIVQFGAVGISGTGVDLTFFLTLTYLLGVHHQISRALSFIIAASWNWFLNRWFTFVGGRDRKPGKQWLAFLVSASVGFTVNWGSYKLLTDNIPYMTQHRLIAFFIGIFLGAGFNYTLSRVFVFRPFEERIRGEGPEVAGEKIV